MSGHEQPTAPPAPPTAEQAWQYMQQQMNDAQRRMEMLHQENQSLRARVEMLAVQASEEKTSMVSPSPGAQLTPGPAAPKRAEVTPAKPDTYSGSRRSSPDVWLFGLESFFKATNISSHEQRVNFAAAQLREAAATWWKRASVLEEAPQTWEEFKAQFLRQFMPVASKETARATLHAMKQRNTVAGYCDAFTNALLQLEDGDMSQEDQLFLFRRGLNKEVALQLNLIRPKTLSEAMSTAVLIEQENRNYQRISGGGNSSWNKGFGTAARNGSGYAGGGRSNGSAPMELGNLNHEEQGVPGHDRDTDDDNEEGQTLNALGNAGRRTNLSPEQVKDYMKRGICFTCAKAGHLSRHCPTRPRPQAQQGSKKF